MPHVVLERIRNAPFRNVQKDSGDSDSRSRLDVRAAYMIEGLELGANMMFVVGSMCFLPAYAHDMDVFLLGCGLFVFGSFVYCCITIYTLCEANCHVHRSRCSLFANLFGPSKWLIRASNFCFYHLLYTCTFKDVLVPNWRSFFRDHGRITGTSSQGCALS